MGKKILLNDDVRLDGSSVCVGSSKRTLAQVINNKERTLTSPGWYRIAKIEVGTGTGTFGSTILLDIHTSFWNNRNMSCLYGINIVYDVARITKISSVTLGNPISCIRLVRNTTEKCIYLDMYYAESNANTIFVNIVQFNSDFVPLIWSIVPETADNETTMASHYTSDDTQTCIHSEDINVANLSAGSSGYFLAHITVPRNYKAIFSGFNCYGQISALNGLILSPPIYNAYILGGGNTYNVYINYYAPKATGSASNLRFRIEYSLIPN